jgi:hypothetical protein
VWLRCRAEFRYTPVCFCLVWIRRSSPELFR